MSYRVEFTAAARRDIAKLPDRVAWAIFEFCDGPLAENPTGWASRWSVT